MMSKTTANISIDLEVKVQAQKLFAELGMDLSTAVNIFLRQAIRDRSFPFTITCATPNSVTLQAMKDAEEGTNLAGPFDSVDELLEELDAED